MGRTSAETDRLRLQGDLLAPHSAQLLRLAGIAPGMRVLDVGCGAGDVSMLLAELVGPDGMVTGVDMDPAVLETARARAAAAGLDHVSFIGADLADLRLDSAGLDVDLGEQIASILRDGGLSVAGAASAGLAGTARSAIPEYLTDTLRSVLPRVLALGLAAEAEVGIDTLAARMTSELEEADATAWVPDLVAAWARVPQ